MKHPDMVKERIYKAIEIANTDPVGQKLAQKLGHGMLLVIVGDELEIPIQICNGNLQIVDDSSHPKAVCRFSDAETAWAILNKKLSPYAATVHKQLDQYGLSPMNEIFEEIWNLAYNRADSSV